MSFRAQLLGLHERVASVDAVVQRRLAGATRESYRQWVCDLYRFVSAFELEFGFTHGLEIGFISPRIKSGKLADDVLALGVTPTQYARLAQSCDVPEFTHPLEGLGWLFVIERLTSQFASMRRTLERVLPREVSIAGSFLRVYDGVMDQRWDELYRMVDTWALGDTDGQRLTRAVTAALEAFEAWMREPSPTTIIIDLERARSA